MDILDALLGRERNRADGLTNRLRDFSRWIIGCGCILVVAIAVGIALLVAGVVQLGEEIIPLILIGVMIVVAVASLVRSQL